MITLTDRMRLIFNVKPVVFEVTDMQVMTNIKGQLPHANRTVMLNPFPPKTDELLISPYNITPESLIKVTRIREIINNERSS